MGFFKATTEADKALRDARHALNEHHENNRKALRAGDPEATRRSEELQDELIAAEENASPGARRRWG